jgi:hypothetical protein
MFSSENGQIMLVGFILIYEMDQLFIFTVLCVIRNNLIYSHMIFLFFFSSAFDSKYKNVDYTPMVRL